MRIVSLGLVTLLVCLAATSCLAGPFAPVLPATFTSFTTAAGASIVANAGAASAVQQGQVEGITDLPVTGAVNRVLPHPKNASILYVGSVNGGVWKTTNALAAMPNWVPLTDSLPSLSIGALEFDYTDTTYNTIVAGIGSQSSDGRLGGLHLGVLRTTDGGKTWTNLGADALYGYRIAGISARGSTIAVCAVGYGLLSSQLYQNGATFYSQDTGATWTQANSESCTDMYPVPSNPTTVFRASLKTGLDMSLDSGVTWQPPIWPAFTTYFNQTIRNIRLSVHNKGTTQQPKYLVYAGFLAKTLQALMRGAQDDKGVWTWSQLDSPLTNDSGVWNGLNPKIPDNPGEGGNGDNGHYYKPGGQGTIHFSITGDLYSDTIVYVGGDRQPTGGNETNPWPNSIGAMNYDGRLFKCDAALPAGNQCIALTHMYASNNSAPHADSRHMRWDASGRILESDDGGVYFRLQPNSTTSGWGSLIGNLQVQEAQGVAYVGNNNFATGNQDTGTTVGAGAATQPWMSLGQGDGAFPRSSRFANGSRILYWSYPFLGGFASTMFDAQANIGVSNQLNLTVAGTNNSLQAWVFGPAPPVGFYQNYAANSVNPNRLLFVFNFDNFAYESFDGGNTVERITIAPGVALQTGAGSSVYGGVVDNVANENLTYAAGLDQLAVRDEQGVWSVTNYPPVGVRWPTIADVAADPTNFNFVAVLGLYGEVSISEDRGQTWTYLTSLQLGVWGMADSMQRRIIVLPGATRRIVVAGRTGVYVFQNSQSKWWRLGGWPNAFVNDMGYDVTDDILYFSTLGRSVWKVQTASKAFTEAAFAAIPVIRPPKVPNWTLMTYVFAALTVVLFLSTLVFAVAFLTTKLRDHPAGEHQPLINEDH